MNAKKIVWLGRILSALVVLFLLFDSVIHIMQIPPVVAAFQQLGYPVSVALPLGIVELVCLALYVYPKTSLLGAVLLTGYLGGAVASNLRISAPFFANVLFPVYVGIFLWGGLMLQSKEIRKMFPFVA